MTNKGLAWCGKIVSLTPIENADLIEAADVAAPYNQLTPPTKA